jgi:hypothetical protein
MMSDLVGVARVPESLMNHTDKTQEILQMYGTLAKK